MPKKIRTRIPEEVEAEILYRHQHTCCVCNEPGHSIQIHHIDGNPANHVFENLAVLCLDDHNQTQTRGGFGRHLKATEVRRYRDEWIRRVEDRRAAADKLAVARMVGSLPETDVAGWHEPPVEPLVRYLESLDEIRHQASAEVASFDHETTVGMGLAIQHDIDVLEKIWIQIAAWFPPMHFGGTNAERYVSGYIAGRFQWHWALIDPGGDRMLNGSSSPLLAADAVRRELTEMIAETARCLVEWRNIDTFDFHQWRKKWLSAE